MAEFYRLGSIPIRVVLYQEDGRWIAHCLEFDLLGDGATQEDALQCLKGAIQTQIDAVVDHDSLESLYFPAEGKYFRMYAEGREIALKATVHFEVKNPVQIERLEAREYLATA